MHSKESEAPSKASRDNPFSIDRLLCKSGNDAKNKGIYSESNANNADNADNAAEHSIDKHGRPIHDRPSLISYPESRSTSGSGTVDKFNLNRWLGNASERLSGYQSGCCCCMNKDQRCLTRDAGIRELPLVECYRRSFSAPKSESAKHTYLPGSSQELARNSCTCTSWLTRTPRSPLYRAAEAPTDGVCRYGQLSVHYGLPDATFQYSSGMNGEDLTNPYRQLAESELDVGLERISDTEKKFDWMTNPRPFYKKG